jgi:hypothetical protein
MIQPDKLVYVGVDLHKQDGGRKDQATSDSLHYAKTRQRHLLHDENQVRIQNSSSIQ